MWKLAVEVRQLSCSSNDSEPVIDTLGTVSIGSELVVTADFDEVEAETEARVALSGAC